MCLNTRRERNLCTGVAEGTLRFLTTNSSEACAPSNTPHEVVLLLIVRQRHDKRTDVSKATRCHCSASENLRRIKRWHKIPGKDDLNQSFHSWHHDVRIWIQNSVQQIINGSLNISKTHYMSSIFLGKGGERRSKRSNSMHWFKNLELWEGFLENLAWTGNKSNERHC